MQYLIGATLGVSGLCLGVMITYFIMDRSHSAMHRAMDNLIYLNNAMSVHLMRMNIPLPNIPSNQFSPQQKSLEDDEEAGHPLHGN